MTDRAEALSREAAEAVELLFLAWWEALPAGQQHHLAMSGGRGPIKEAFKAGALATPAPGGDARGLERARDVNDRLVAAYMIVQGIRPDAPWPDVSDITADEARQCGAIVSAAQAAQPSVDGWRTFSCVIEGYRGPLYLAHALMARVRADEAAIRVLAAGKEADHG